MALQRSQLHIAVASFASYLLVLSVILGWNNAADRRAVLFDWSAWSHEQAHLSRKAESLTSKLSKVSVGSGDKITKEIEAQGRNIDRGLHAITRMISPQKHKSTVRRTMPMDQALEMIKVQDQMRKEHKYPSDRIEGAGDATGLVSEKDAADLRKLLGQPTFQPTATSRVYENCRDGSLTVEDAELCERKADAIKLLTQQAAAQQMSEAPEPQRIDREKEIQREKEDAAKRELVADAFVGKQYLYRLAHPSSNIKRSGVMGKAAASLSGVASKLRHLHKSTPFHYVTKSARKQQLVNTYQDHLSDGSKVMCTCDAAAAGDEEMEGLSSSVRPACTCTGGKQTHSTHTETGGPLDTGPYGTWPQGLPAGPNRIDGVDQEAYKAPGGGQQQLAGVDTLQDSFTAEHTFVDHMHPLLSKHGGAGAAAAAAGVPQSARHKRKLGRRAISLKRRRQVVKSVAGNGGSGELERDGGEKATALGTLSALKAAVDKAAVVQPQPRLRQLEAAITDEERRLAQTKVLFARELRRRQEAIERRFSRENERLKDGIEVIAAGMPPVARAATEEVLRGQASLNPPAAPLPNPLATAGLLESSGPAAGTPLGTVSSAEMARQALVDKMVVESMPVPLPGAAALAEPVAPVTAPVVKDPVVKAIMTDVANSRLFAPSPPPATENDSEKSVMQAALDKQFDEVASEDPPPTAAARQAAREANSWGSLVKQMTLTVTHANSPPAPPAPAQAPAVPAVPAHVLAQKLSAAVPRAGARGPAGAGGLRKEEYGRLSTQAVRDLRRALAGRPTLAAAAAAAVRADKSGGGGGPAAEMRDAVRVLCTVEQLKAGRCSGVRDTAATAAAAAAAASAHKDYLSVPKSEVPPSALKMASDLVHSLASLV